MSEVLFNQDEVVSALKSGICNLSFYKLDGSIREMRATLSPDILPKVEATKTARAARKGISVFDTEINEWRSFLIENLIRLERA